MGLVQTVEGVIEQHNQKIKAFLVTLLPFQFSFFF